MSDQGEAPEDGTTTKQKNITQYKSFVKDMIEIWSDRTTFGY